MRSTLINQVTSENKPEVQQQKLREGLQHVILQEMDRMGFFEQVCFLGGTALRILYDLKRFSEDLDFSARPNSLKKNYPDLLKALQKKLTALDLLTKDLKIKSTGAVLSTFFKFPKILYEVNPKVFRTSQLLSIKWEIDTKPPAGSMEMLSTVSADYLYSVRHYDLPSLFAGKLHAILYRPYTKARDLYDFFWYTSRGIKVNGTLLQNAMQQTEDKKVLLSEAILKKRLTQRGRQINFAQANKEITKFLLDLREADLLKKDLFLAQVPKIKIGR